MKHAKKASHSGGGPRPTILVVAAVLIAGAIGAVLFFTRGQSASSGRVSSGGENSKSNRPGATMPGTVRQPMDDATLYLKLFGTNQLPEDGEQLINGGNELLARGYIPQAVRVYERAVRLKPDDEEAHFDLAFAYSRAQRTTEAIREYQAALSIFSEYSEAHNNLGNLLLAQKKYDDAAEHFSIVLRLDPENTSALNNLGKTLALQGRFSEAVSQFGEAVRLNPSFFEARFNLGNAYVSLDRIDEALSEFDQVLRLNPGFKPAIAAINRAKAKKAGGPRPR